MTMQAASNNSQVSQARQVAYLKAESNTIVYRDAPSRFGRFMVYVMNFTTDTMKLEGLGKLPLSNPAAVHHQLEMLAAAVGKKPPAPLDGQSPAATPGAIPLNERQARELRTMDSQAWQRRGMNLVRNAQIATMEQDFKAQKAASARQDALHVHVARESFNACLQESVIRVQKARVMNAFQQLNLGPQALSRFGEHFDRTLKSELADGLNAQPYEKLGNPEADYSVLVAALDRTMKRMAQGSDPAVR